MFTDSPEASRQTAAGIGSMFGIPAEQVLRMPLALIGTPDEVVAELKRREREWGVGHYIVSGFGGPVYAERFAREVLPRV
jgi:alkanesulfonate monooxygenase SsuD/methylene tetrahydromethanopterin reductase-like flavin-dependent oxidoreductase (luciferase family)